MDKQNKDRINNLIKNEGIYIPLWYTCFSFDLYYICPAVKEKKHYIIVECYPY